MREADLVHPQYALLVRVISRNTALHQAVLGQQPGAIDSARGRVCFQLGRHHPRPWEVPWVFYPSTYPMATSSGARGLEVEGPLETLMCLRRRMRTGNPLTEEFSGLTTGLGDILILVAIWSTTLHNMVRQGGSPGNSESGLTDLSARLVCARHGGCPCWLCIAHIKTCLKAGSSA